LPTSPLELIMSWQLSFYRRVGQPELIIEELDPVFERAPRFTRVPPREEDPQAELEVRFRYENPISQVSFEFSFQSPSESDEEAPGRADFPFEETTLVLRLPLERSAETAQEAIPVAIELCQQLNLFPLDLQDGQELPGRPDAEALIRSYLDYCRGVEETIDFLHRRRKQMASSGCFLFLIVLLILLALSFFRR
jgi:hypothetical protein